MSTLGRLNFLTIVLIALGLLSGCANNGPAKTVETFFRSIEKGDLDIAVDQLSIQITGTFGRDKLKVSLSEFSQDINAVGGIESIETDETINGNVAVVNYSITIGDGSTENGTMDLIKEDGDWKIQDSP